MWQRSGFKPANQYNTSACCNHREFWFGVLQCTCISTCRWNATRRNLLYKWISGNCFWSCREWARQPHSCLSLCRWKWMCKFWQYHHFFNQRPWMWNNHLGPRCIFTQWWWIERCFSPCFIKCQAIQHEYFQPDRAIDIHLRPNFRWVGWDLWRWAMSRWKLCVYYRLWIIANTPGVQNFIREYNIG